MNQTQKSLAIAITKRDAATATLERFRQSVAVLAAAVQTASKAESEAQAQLETATMAKVRGEADATSNARNVYQLAMADLAVAETEMRAGKKVIVEAEAELERCKKDAARCAVEVAKAIAKAEETALLSSAIIYGKALARHKSLIRFARAASATSGVVTDPIPELNANNPLKVKIDDVVNGQTFDLVTQTEGSILDAKIGGAA